MFLNNIYNLGHFRHVIGMARNVRRATVLLPFFDGVLALECDSRKPKCAKHVLVLRMFARLVFSTSSTVSSIRHIDLTIFFSVISRVTIIKGLSFEIAGLPVQVRDQLLRVNSSDFPKSDVNREYYIQQIEREVLLLCTSKRANLK